MSNPILKQNSEFEDVDELEEEEAMGEEEEQDQAGSADGKVGALFNRDDLWNTMKHAHCAHVYYYIFHVFNNFFSELVTKHMYNVHIYFRQ